MKTRIALTAYMIALIACAVPAQAAISTFSDFAPGSINLQGGWTTEDCWGYDKSESGAGPNLDEAIVDDGTGNKVWRISNQYSYTSYSSQPFSPRAAQVAGQAGSSLWNDFGPDHTNPYSPAHYGANPTTNLFHSGFDVRSATGAAQPGMTITVSASAKQSAVRQTYLRILDNGTNGLDMVFNDDFGNHTIATGLDYGSWHHIDMDIEFVDGLIDFAGNPYTLHPGDPGFNAGDVYGNDIVKVYVDGQLAITGTSWEGYFYGYENGKIQAVDSLLFRVASQANTLDGGYYFDNVDISNSPVPEPATMTVLALGGLALIRRRSGVVGNRI